MFYWTTLLRGERNVKYAAFSVKGVLYECETLSKLY